MANVEASPRFHFNVVYSDSDAEWVEGTLLARLADRRLTGSARGLHTQPGGFWVSEDVHLMDTSPCVLLLVGGDFAHSCRLQMHHALKMSRERDTLVVPLLRVGARLPQELRGVIQHLPVPDAPREPDWDKLAGRLKDRCRQVNLPLASRPVRP